MTTTPTLVIPTRPTRLTILNDPGGGYIPRIWLGRDEVVDFGEHISPEATMRVVRDFMSRCGKPVPATPRAAGTIHTPASALADQHPAPRVPAAELPDAVDRKWQRRKRAIAAILALTALAAGAVLVALIL